MKEKHNNAFENLTPREKVILLRRFGVGTRREHSLKELGEMFGITKERVRQIERAAIKRMIEEQIDN